MTWTKQFLKNRMLVISTAFLKETNFEIGEKDAPTVFLCRKTYLRLYSQHTKGFSYEIELRSEYRAKYYSCYCDLID